MTPQVAFRRKIIYLVGIAALLALLSFLGRPTTQRSQTSQGSPGGLLARAREAHGLSQTQLGEIDPTSETIKLATLGMRGVATNILWTQANQYKMKKDWTNLSATLERVALLQPNFMEVWRHQSWNLAYNVSIEFDDFRQRYRWVIRGIKFLEKGIHYNELEPKLTWYMGWMISQKIGKSDEHRQFRRLFKADDDFHDWLPFEMQDPSRDNWLVGQRWFRKSEWLVDERGASIGGMSPAVFRSDAPMCQMNYASAVEQDGVFGQVARMAWTRASELWHEFGALGLTTSSGEEIRLNEKDELLELAEKKAGQLDALQPGLREKIAEEKHETLTDEQREALDTPRDKRSPEQQTLAAQAERFIKVDHEEVALRIDREHRTEARALAEEIQKYELKARLVGRYRDVVNFEYWRRRAEFEQDPHTLTARKLVYQGEQALESADLGTAKAKYEEGFAAWRQVFDNYPDLLEDPVTLEDTKEIVSRYRRVLHLHDLPFPKDFILQDVLDAAPRAQ